MGKSEKIDKRVAKMQKKALKYIKNFCVDTPELKESIKQTETEEELVFVILDNALMEVYFKLYDDGLDLISFFNAWSLYDYQKTEKKFLNLNGEEKKSLSKYVADSEAELAKECKLLEVDESEEAFEAAVKDIMFLSEKTYDDLKGKREKHIEMIGSIKNNIKRKINRLRWEIQVLEEATDI